MEDVPLKEFLELKIAYEAIKIEHVRELIEERDKALKLKAEANEIHFTALNHEAAQLKSMQSTYIPREVHDAEINQIKKELSESKEWRANREGRESRAYWMAVLAIIVSVVLALIKFKV